MDLVSKAPASVVSKVHIYYWFSGIVFLQTSMSSSLMSSNFIHTHTFWLHSRFAGWKISTNVGMSVEVDFRFYFRSPSKWPKLRKLSSKIEVKKVDLSVSRAIFRLNSDFGKNEKIEISWNFGPWCSEVYIFNSISYGWFDEGGSFQTILPANVCSASTSRTSTLNE